MLIAASNAIKDIPADKVIQLLKDVNQFFMNAWYLLIGFAGLTPIIMWFIQNRIAKAEEKKIKDSLKEHFETYLKNELKNQIDKFRIEVDEKAQDSFEKTQKLVKLLLDFNMFNLGLHLLNTNEINEAILQFANCTEFALKCEMDGNVNSGLDNLINKCFPLIERNKLSNYNIELIEKLLNELKDNNEQDKYTLGIKSIEKFLDMSNE